MLRTVVLFHAKAMLHVDRSQIDGAMKVAPILMDQRTLKSRAMNAGKSCIDPNNSAVHY